ncbi:hypothetical protein ACT453_28100 [Bacillus sp. D-CC]
MQQRIEQHFRTKAEHFGLKTEGKDLKEVRKCCSIRCCISFCSGFSAALTGSALIAFSKMRQVIIANIYLCM